MEKHYPPLPWVGTIQILRRSIFTFLQNYQYFTTTTAFFAFPFAVSLLLAQSFAPSSTLQSTVHNRLRLLFYAAEFPNSSGFVPILSLKLSKTISVFLIISPLSFSFPLFAKASVLLALNNSNRASQPAFEQAISAYKLLLITQVCNLLLVLSANVTYMAILFFAFNALDTVLILSSGGAVLYSIILAYAMTICNLALVLSAADQRCGFIVILRACVLIKGRAATGLSLLLSLNMVLASVEALFQYRIVRAYHQSETSFSSMILEGMFIAYIYAIILVLDTVIAFFFFRSCKSLFKIDQEMKHLVGIAQLDEKVGNGLITLKSFDEL